MSKKKHIDTDFPDKIAAEVKVENIKEFLNNNYLPYSHYVIRSRALVGPDGLKPVQQRGLWGLYDLKLFSNSPKMKAATVYNHVVGHFHPHGPSSVSDAMAKLGQPFTSRVPLLDVQGSVGFQTGDKPSADRYYEIRMNKAAEALIEDVKYNAAKMIYNYSDTELLPAQFPAKWPFAIINGGQGIAVGYATNMLPHNPDEVMNAVIKRMTGKIKNTKQLLKVMSGPDFPTGGVIYGIDGIEEYYETGKGSFLVRGQYELQPLKRGRHIIRFYELPYQISIEKVKEEIKKKQQKSNVLTGITEVKNLSDPKRGNSLSITVKAGVNPQIVIEELFKHTSLESRFSVNNTVLANGAPKVENMLELIDTFIELRKETFIRKKEYRLKQINERLERAEGLSKVIIDIDKTIELIKNSESSSEASKKLMKEFEITEEQANYILGLSLSVLTKADRDKILLEIERLKEEQDEIEKLLSSEELVNEAIIEELKATKKLISDKRLTLIDNVTSEDLAEAEKESRAKMRMLNNNSEAKFYVLSNGTIVMTFDEDLNTHVPISYELKIRTKDTLNVLLKNGNVEEVKAEAIPLDLPGETSLLGVDESKISSILPASLGEDYEGVLVVTNYGNVNIVKNNIKSPLVKLVLGEEIVYSKALTSEDKEKMLYMIAEDGQLAKFPVSAVRESNAGSGTVAGFKYDNPTVSAIVADEDALITSVSKNTIKSTMGETVPSTSRGVKGSRFHLLDDNDKIISIHAAHEVKVANEDDSIEVPITDRAKKGEPYSGHIFLGY